MLTTNYKENEVITLKLSTGEEVLGYYVDSDADQITLRKPVTLVVTSNEGGVALAPFIMTSDYIKDNTKLKFYKTGIIVDLKAGEDFTNAYTKQMSGIDLSAETKPGLII